MHIRVRYKWRCKNLSLPILSSPPPGGWGTRRVWRRGDRGGASPTCPPGQSGVIFSYLILYGRWNPHSLRTPADRMPFYSFHKLPCCSFSLSHKLPFYSFSQAVVLQFLTSCRFTVSHKLPFYSLTQAAVLQFLTSCRVTVSHKLPFYSIILKLICQVCSTSSKFTTANRSFFVQK